MFFAGSEKLENEFDELYASLFEHPEPYIAIVTALARKKCGMTREEVSRASGVDNNGSLSRYLRVLEQCGFIRKFTELGKKTKGAVVRRPPKRILEQGQSFVTLDDLFAD